jgi:signal transduction histidine kinase/ligand-binding sensor domain-containing protein
MLSAAPRLNVACRAGRCKAMLLIALLILLPTASAAPAQYHVDSWTTENGLPQNIIRDMCQTPDGYLWLATLDGLVRFDGVRFVVFNRSNTAGIEGNRFMSLYCAANGDFWAGTEYSGITRYSQGRFTTYMLKQGLSANDVPGVTGDDAGHVWVLSHTSIMQWNGTGFQLAGRPLQLSDCRYYSNGRSGFWCVKSDRLYLFVRGQDRSYSLPPGWSFETHFAVGEDLSGALWLADGQGRFARQSQGRWSGALRADKDRDQLVSTFRGSFDDSWTLSIGSDAAGFLTQAVTVPSGGQQLRIAFNTFLEDREGSIWLTTDGQGLYRLRRQTVLSFSKEDGLPDRNIYPIYQDRGGTIWIGTWNGGLAQFSEGKFTPVPLAGGSAPSRISSIFEDRDGALWVATTAGLYKRGPGQPPSHFEAVRNALLESASGVRAIAQDAGGALWFGTSHGLVRLKDGNWNVLITRDGLATDDVRVILNGREGNLWIGGYGGLTSLDPARANSGGVKAWNDANGLPNNTIRSLYEDSDGVLWIGTYDSGLVRFADGKFTRFTVRDGLFNNGVFQILEDGRGFLWMSCNRGIYRIAKRELNEFAAGKRSAVFSTVYGKGEGIRNAECNGGLSPAGIRARDGKLWFPTQDGVAVVAPEAVTANPLPPPVVIESVALDRTAQPLDRPVRVPPGSENLDIDYTALSFLDSEHIRFRYKLEGLDRGWVEADTRRTAYYSHLPPGDYTFKVIAANSDGVWNLEGSQLRISVLPRFYQTWWFFVLAALAAAGTVYVFWQSRMSRLEHARAVQEAFSQQLIASQESERKRIAAELHDSLGQHLLIIKNWAVLALKGLSTASSPKEPLTEISTTASKAIDEVREISYNLRPYQLEKLGLTTAIRDLAEQVASASAIRVTVEADDVDNVFPKDVEIGIYRMVQECLNNVVRHSHAAEARIAVTRRGDMVRLTVEDNGRGFTPPDSRAPEPGRKGFGLLGISERARMMGGHAIIQSAPGAGTTVTISLKTQESAG